MILFVTERLANEFCKRNPSFKVKRSFETGGLKYKVVKRMKREPKTYFAFLTNGDIIEAQTKTRKRFVALLKNARIPSEDIEKILPANRLVISSPSYNKEGF